MFTGRSDIFKDKDGRYFIDADWKIFKYILEYLKNGDQFDVSYAREGLFGNKSEVRFGAVEPDMMATLHREAKQFGIKSLVEKLERHQSLFTKKKIEEFKNKVPFFDETVDKILDVLTGEALLSYDSMTIQLCPDAQGDRSQCCEHTCCARISTSVGFGFTSMQYQELQVDTKIQVSYKVTVPILKSICMDLIARGFSVNGRVERCSHACKRPYSTQGGFSFSSNSCSEVLYLLRITWHIFAIQSSRQSLFGENNHQQSAGFCFGKAAAQSTGLFGTSAEQPAFGQSETSVFGSPQNTQNSFSGFKTTNANTSGVFGSQKVSFGFGSPSGFSSNKNAQGTQGGFGNAPVFSFGCSPQNSTAKGNVPSTTSGGGLFGSSPFSSSSFGSSPFGSPPQNNQNFVSGNRLRFSTSQSTQQRSSGFTFGNTGVPSASCPVKPQETSKSDFGLFGVNTTNDSNKGRSPFSFGQSNNTSVLQQSNADGQSSGVVFGSHVFGGAATFQNNLSPQRSSLTQAEHKQKVKEEEQKQWPQKETPVQNIFSSGKETTATKPLGGLFGYGTGCTTPPSAESGEISIVTESASSTGSSGKGNDDVKEGCESL